MTIRKAVFAGSFYPSGKEELKNCVKELLDNTRDVAVDGKLKALIVPHAGYQYSGPVAATAYKLLSNLLKSNSNPPAAGGLNSLVLLGPSHSIYLDSAAMDNNDFWQTPLGDVKCVKTNNPQKPITILPEAHTSEHCLEVQLPFLQYLYAINHKFTPSNFIAKFKGPFTIHPIVAGDMDAKKLAAAITPLIQDKLLLVSSDLSHYYQYEEAVKLDKATANAILALDTENMSKKGEACGLIPILTILEIAKANNWKVKLLDLRNSGDTGGDKNRVVGYGAFAFYI